MTYTSSCGNFEIPRTEFLLHDVKAIESAIIAWYKKYYYKQGDDYSVRITNRGSWEVSYSNDYPLQHGSGSKHILSGEDFAKAMFEFKQKQPTPQNRNK